MFASFLPPFGARSSIAPYLWVLYKQITHLAPNEVVFIGTPGYFQNPSNFDVAQNWDISHHSREYAGFDIPTYEQLDAYRRFLLPDKLFAEQEHHGLSPHEVMRQMLTTRIAELEISLRPILAGLKHTDNIEAVFTWCNVPSLTAVAADLGIPVIHNELGALRAPCYQWTAYFDFQGVNGATEATSRFGQFQAEHAEQRVPILSKGEILTLVLIDPGMLESTTPPEMAIGLPLQVEDDTNIIAFSNGWNNQRLIDEANALHGHDNILIRHHPGGLKSYPDTSGLIDKSSSSIAFIRRCRQIATINSSIGLEALLWDVDTRILGDSPIAIAASKSMGPDACPPFPGEQLLALNFLVFGYLIPYEFLYNPDYIRWRLGRPTEAAIFAFHLTYWRMKQRLLAERFRFRSGNDNLNNSGLLSSRLLHDYQLSQRIRELTAQVEMLEARTHAIEETCERMRLSLSWRLTSPLRAIDSLTGGKLRYLVSSERKTDGQGHA
ncbi:MULTISPECIES: GT99 family glycosyltransferase N-terminal domain-containing protein [Candidatus Accumulibacter]|uniref:Glycosyltransferase 99 N-terminal domain-containing protein n=1 Tax=Candidatus Accumulibacter phosphatis TaxID=327160 RepID=A0A5S4ELM2_9PROT|nr:MULTISPECIES: hypothetical protein [Candidatus Accumulibacter]MBL8401382.1 hypothetical protein [Accumulibacter sp.]TMQ76165.1 hypothetical protein ACCUM_0043 [Candidatus Accumulibacter phosphatis]